VEFATDADVVMSLLNCERLGWRRAALESAEFEREQLHTHLAKVLEEAQQNEARSGLPRDQMQIHVGHDEH
jgi:hypothetical protein